MSCHHIRIIVIFHCPVFSVSSSSAMAPTAKAAPGSNDVVKYTILNYSTTDCLRSNANCREAVQRLEHCHFPKGATSLERNYGVPWPYYFEVRFGTDTEIVIEIDIDAGFALLTLNMTLILTLIKIKVIEILKNVSKSEMTLSGVTWIHLTLEIVSSGCLTLRICLAFLPWSWRAVAP